MSLIQCKSDSAPSRAPVHVPAKAVASGASGMPRFLRQDSSRENRTGLPIYLKDRVESLSGVDLSDVRVHRNSSKPDRMNALAYTQGRDIHLGPGQEHHLPHEAWHAVQQKYRASLTYDVRVINLVPLQSHSVPLVTNNENQYGLVKN